MEDKKLELYQALLAKKRERGLEDLYFFNKYIIESDPKRQQMLVPHVHGEWARWFNASDSRIRLILVPRGTFKSSFFTVGWALQQIAKDRSTTGLIANATLANAQRFLGDIKNHLRSNKRLIELYGKFYEKNTKWNEDEIEVVGRGLSVREPTVTATGVGGNLVSQHYCLYPDTKVLTSNGYIEAKDLRKGIRVLSHDGRFHPIVAVSDSKSEEGVSIRPQYQAEYSHFSPNHRIYVYRDGNFKWVLAKDILSTDMLCVPISKAYNSKPSKVNKRINKLFNEPDVWRLMGYWLAKGCHTPDGNQIRMTFSDKELSFVKDIEEIVTEHLGVPVSHRKTKNSTYIVCFSDKDFKKIIDKFGTKSYTKHLPPIILNNDANKQRELVLGYFRGDGCIYENNISFVSTSLDLLTGIQLILAKFGIASGISQSTKAGKTTIVGNPCHQRDSWQLGSTSPMLKTMLGFEANFPTKPIRSFFTDKYWVVPVRDIKRTKEPSKTYDIQVADTETMYCQGMIVHNSWIIADDLVNSENSATRYQAEKVIDWWRKSLSLLNPNGIMLIIGTRWTYYELYAYLLEELSHRIDSYIRGAYNEDGSFYFPERYNEEKLKELKEYHGSYLFSSFYLNSPVDKDSALIKKSHIKYFKDKPEGLNVFSACDPAFSQSEGADYSAIVTVGVDKDSNWYVLEVRRGKWTVTELINNLFSVYDRFSPISMSIEVIGQSQGILSPIRAEEEKRKKYLPLMEIKSRPPLEKETRIRAELQPRFENGKVFIKKNMEELETELLHFPHSRYDDVIDSLCDIATLEFPAEPSEAEKERLSKMESRLRAHFGDNGFVDETCGENW